MTPAEQIRQARGSESRAAAARRIGVPLRTLEDWEAGKRNPKPLMLQAVLRALSPDR